MHPTDNPTDLDRLPRIRRLALLEWIRLAVLPAKKPSGHTSYWLAAEYEAAGGHVSNGAFKRAMQLSGYDPIDPSETNWRFRCHPAGSSKRDAAYSLHHVKPQERQLFDRLVRTIRDCERQRSAYPLCVLVAGAPPAPTPSPPRLLRPYLHRRRLGPCRRSDPLGLSGHRGPRARSRDSGRRERDRDGSDRYGSACPRARCSSARCAGYDGIAAGCSAAPQQ